MRMRAALPFLLAAVMGVAAAALVACGSSDSRSDLIPQSSAGRLNSALSDLRRAVDAGECTAAARALARARGILVTLPPSVDARLVARLRQGLDNLDNIAPRECGQNATESTPTTTESTPTTTETHTRPTTPTHTTTTPTTTTGTTTTTTPTTTTGPPDTTGGATTP